MSNPDNAVPKAAPDQASRDKAMATVTQVEALADQLSAVADEIHARIMKDMKAYQGRTATEAEQALARGMLEDEVVLRQRADSLYAEAATYVVQSLSTSQQQLMQLTADAGEKIRRIGRLADAAGLIGSVLMLAGAAVSGQVAPIVVAVERLGKQVKKIKG